tara:strand:- start:120 stop:632 length:513 start_codon:yes stop_codon:yes gene_type:complete
MFDERVWDTVTQIVAERLRLSIGELDRLRRNPVAKLIAAMPFIAACENPDRVATQHLATYLLAESAENIFDHRREDDRDVFTRLERISHFPGGDRRLIQRGMSLLALVMIADHDRDRETDRAQSVYNPLVSGAWNADEIRRPLVKRIRATPCAEMDAILDLERALRGNWN